MSTTLQDIVWKYTQSFQPLKADPGGKLINGFVIDAADNGYPARLIYDNASSLLRLMLDFNHQQIREVNPLLLNHLQRSCLTLGRLDWDKEDRSLMLLAGSVCQIDEVPFIANTLAEDLTKVLTDDRWQSLINLEVRRINNDEL